MGDDEDLSLFELFRMEAEERVANLQRLLLQVQGGGGDAKVLQSLMRDAHSLKGAARITEMAVAVTLTHAMEDRFVAAEEGRALTEAEIDRLLRCCDLLELLGALPDESAVDGWERAHRDEIGVLAAGLSSTGSAEPPAHMQESSEPASRPTPQAAGAATAEAAVLPERETALTEPAAASIEPPVVPQGAAEPAGAESSLRMSAARLGRIMAGASDNLVRLESLLAQNGKLQKAAEQLRVATAALAEAATGPHDSAAMRAAVRGVATQEQALRQLLLDLENALYGAERTAKGVHREILQARMRSIREVVPNWQRLVRTVSAELGKKVRLDVQGERTDVDRDILEQLRAPMEHLLRNSLDHGLETPDVRRAAGKPETGTLRVWARHHNGRLAISVSDDGAGVDFRAVRSKAEARGLVLPAMTAKMSEDEVLQFLFLPGFSTRDVVSELSGRGYGLDVVQSTVHGAGGSIRIDTRLGEGTGIHMTLPISHSVLRVMLVQVGDETFALPATRLSRIEYVSVAMEADGGCYVDTDNGRVAIESLTAAMGGAVLPPETGRTTAVFLLDDDGHEAEVALAVDRPLGDALVAVGEVDPRLGRSDALAGIALTESGMPMLILETAYLLRVAVSLRRRRWSMGQNQSHAATVLVADDSHTVRQMLRRVLIRAKYRVVVAEHGAEAWALLQTQPFDLLISDVDMPEMTGIELTANVRDNARLQHMPVVLLSYKGRDEDRRRGLEAGADMYFSKGEFEEHSFLQVVTDLIGPSTLEEVPSALEEAGGPASRASPGRKNEAEHGN